VDEVELEDGADEETDPDEDAEAEADPDPPERPPLDELELDPQAARVTTQDTVINPASTARGCASRTPGTVPAGAPAQRASAAAQRSAAGQASR
jgi:hypothetical protein